MEAGTASTPSSSETTTATTMASLAAVAAQKFAGKPALRHKVGDEWVDIDQVSQAAEAYYQIACRLG